MAYNPKTTERQKVLFKITDFWPGKPMCKAAGFELWKLSETGFVVPVPGTTTTDDLIAADPIGFLTADPLVMGEHEMGDYKGQPDNWRGVHAFDRIDL